MISRTMVAIVVAIVLTQGTSAWAEIVVTPESSTTTDYTSLISATDLINSGQTSFASASLAGGLNGGSLAGSHDGIGGAVMSSSAWAYTPPATFEYYLNTNASTGGSASGYDITSVDLFAGWDSYASFGNQSWSLAVATLANPTWTTVGPVTNCQPFTTSDVYGFTHVKLADSTGVIATGVWAVQIVTYSNYTIVNEIDVAGSATVPEPGTLALLATGLIGLLAYAWRKRR
jgi:hypothetical protein